MKRILASLLAVCMVLSMLVVVPFTATAAVTGADENNLGANESLVGYKAVVAEKKDGVNLAGLNALTDAITYVIDSVEGMTNFATLAASNDFKGKTVYLNADIDLSEAGFTGIPNFAGTFDGQSYKVTLKGNRLFTKVTGPAVIKNVEGNGIALGVIGAAIGNVNGAVTIHNVLSNFQDPNTGTQKVGGILGDLQAGTVNVTNCTNAGPITVNANSSFSGGIVGYVTENAGGTIENCLNTGKLVGKEYFGGIVGIQYAGTLTITNCVNTGAIEAAAFAAGIHGCVIGTAHISNCTNKGTVAGKGTSSVNSKAIGGIAGQIGNGSITNCLNVAGANISNVKGTGTGSANGELVGGIAGNVPSAAVSIGNCKNEATVTASEGKNVGGIIGNCAGINSGVANCTNTGAITAGNGGGIVGGIVGQDSGTVTVYTNCKNTGAVMAGRSGNVEDHLGGTFAGGLVGSAKQITVDNCENTGAVTATGSDTDSHSYVGGLIATVNERITVSNFTNSGKISSVGNKLGGVVGNLYGSVASRFENCTNNGFVTTNGGICGGLIGYTTATDITILNCKNYEVINGQLSGNVRVGGIIGAYDVNGSLSITNTENHGDITIGNTDHVGGFIGESNGIPKLTNCANYGNITSTKQRISGFLGFATGATFTNCTNYGDVTAGTERAGAFVGYGNNGTFALTDCVNYGTITGTQAAGLLALVCSATTLTNCVNYGLVISSSLAGSPIVGQATENVTLVNVQNYAKVTNKDGVSSLKWFIGYGTDGKVFTADNASADYSTTTQWLGYQTRVNETDSSKLDLRLVGTVDSLDYYQVGFIVTRTHKTTGATATLTKSVVNAYEELYVENGENVTVPAYRGDGAYLFAISIEGIPADEIDDYTFEVQTYTVATQGAQAQNGEKREAFTVQVIG